MNEVDAIGPFAENGPLALYVHWPFCVSKCPYCDFNSHVRDKIDHTAFLDAYLKALKAWGHLLPKRQLVSIFFGGGTPSLMDPSIASAVIDEARRLWSTSNDLEVTLEANPNSAEAVRFRSFAEAGVNRISIGVQALDNDALKFLGRAHDQNEALKAIEAAQKAVERVSFDLIYGRPGQSVTAWKDELGRAISLGTTHLSAYQLTIEKGTPFFSMAERGAFEIPNEDIQADLYEATRDVLMDAGLPAYEISNHAKPGQECRHNLVYWRYGDYIGIGPGAHGRLTNSDGISGLASSAHRKPEAWLTATRGGDPLALSEINALLRDERVDEMTMMGLRLTSGITRAAFECIAGGSLESRLNRTFAERMMNGGYLVIDADGIRATDAGRARLNTLIAGLMA